MRIIFCFCLLSAVALAMPSASVASPGVQVFGPEETFFAQVRDRLEIPARINTLWDFISSYLGAQAEPGPVVYLYPFDRKVQPSLLTELQDKIAADIPGYKEHPEKFERIFEPLAGITYEATLLPTDSPLRGRIIQINTRRAYLNEAAGERGYGLYLTLHEMTHYALNTLGIDPKFHHCLMIRENARGESILLKFLGEQSAKGWASENLSLKGGPTKGYAEEKHHCDVDVMMVRQNEGAEALNGFSLEVDRLANRFLR